MNGRAIGVDTASMVATDHRPHAVVREALANFEPDEGSTRLRSSLCSTDEGFQELEHLEDPAQIGSDSVQKQISLIVD